MHWSTYYICVWFAVWRCLVYLWPIVTLSRFFCIICALHMFTLCLIYLMSLLTSFWHRVGLSSEHRLLYYMICSITGVCFPIFDTSVCPYWEHVLFRRVSCVWVHYLTYVWHVNLCFSIIECHRFLDMFVICRGFVLRFVWHILGLVLDMCLHMCWLCVH